MTGISYQKDLVVLVPDRNTEFAVKGVLTRPQALGIREISSEIFVHTGRDSGCYLGSHDFLRPMCHNFRHALVIFDRVGCGREDHSREEIEEKVGLKLAVSGWEDRAAVVVIDPELEAWVWSDSPQVASCLGWTSDLANLRRWLSKNGWWPSSSLKPPDPKLAVEQVLRKVRKPRSSAIYEQLARRVSFQRCTDPAFLKFRHIMREWFGR
jgi:hypothetical protein